MNYAGFKTKTKKRKNTDFSANNSPIIFAEKNFYVAMKHIVLFVAMQKNLNRQSKESCRKGSVTSI